MIIELKTLRKEASLTKAEVTELKKYIDEQEMTLRKVKDDTASMHQKSKTEFSQAKNEIMRELAQTRKERDSLEVRLKEILHETQRSEEHMHRQLEKASAKESA